MCSMKCIIPGINVKIFARAIHSLSKIGDELYFEPLDESLALRTVNSSRSAYACFLFRRTFFTSFLVSDVVDSEEDSVRCKIATKCCLSVFKSVSSLEKTVDKCKLKLDVKEARLVFQLHCKHGIVKTYNLAYIECETLQAVFSKNLCPNELTAQSRLLSDAVLNFQNTQEEVSLIVDPESVRLKNYTEDEPDPNKVVHTEVTLVPDEFDSYQVGVDTDVTFCLKELRAILTFTEFISLPLTAHFETAGKPIVFSISSDPSFEANFVLATLADRVGETSQPSVSKPTEQRATTAPRTQKQKPNSARNPGHSKMTKTKQHEGRQTIDQSDARDYESITDIHHRASSKNNNRVNETELEVGRRAISDELDVVNEAEESIPGTPPPSKKFKSMFFGLSQSTARTTQSQQSAAVLAEDTDEDD